VCEDAAMYILAMKVTPYSSLKKEDWRSTLLPASLTYFFSTIGTTFEEIKSATLINTSSL
jgi:hypothetical protein